MRRITWKKYAGVRKRGNRLFGLMDSSTCHLEKAAWLTAQVESGGKYGTVMNYDGTGMTAGIHQAIAVYPRELAHEDFNAKDDQGPLFKLLARILSLGLYNVKDTDLLRMLAYKGWYVSKEGRLRQKGDGKLVAGRYIREEFTGAANGCMPVNGPGRKRAEAYVKAFHVLFSDPETFIVQDEFGMEHFIKRSERVKLRFCKKKELKNQTIHSLIYDFFGAHISNIVELTPEMDLAMSIFWSFTVNAPGAALKVFCRVADKHMIDTFPKALIRALGKSKFGRWGMDKKNGRYQRTRNAARKKWPKGLFEGPQEVMPKTF